MHAALSGWLSVAYPKPDNLCPEPCLLLLLHHMITGTEAERLYKALFKRRAGDNSEHLMVTDKRGRIVYMTTKVRDGYSQQQHQPCLWLVAMLFCHKRHIVWGQDKTNLVEPWTAVRSGSTAWQVLKY
jgi:hypothetical protein